MSALPADDVAFHDGVILAALGELADDPTSTRAFRALRSWDILRRDDPARFAARRAALTAAQWASLRELLDDEPAVAASESPIEPADIFRASIAAPFDPDDAPPAIGRVARAFAEATGFDVSGAIVAAVIAGAAAIDDRWRLAVRPQSDWFESARLWGVLIGSPAAGKSPTITMATRALKDLHAEARAQWTRDCANIEGDAERPPMPAVFTTDATVEALADRLRDNPRGLLVVTEEFSSWLGAFDAYRGGAGAKDRGDWLQLYDGGPRQIDRVVRGSFMVPNWGASLLAAGTPAGLRDLGRKLPDDGLIHRFIPCIMRSPVEPGSTSARDMLRDWSVRLREVHRETTTDRPAVRLRLTTEARGLFEAEVREIRDALERLHEVAPSLAAHCGKHPGMIARVAIVFHEVERRPGDAIEADTMRQAIRFMRTVRGHARELFLGILGGSPTIELAQSLARSIVADASRPTQVGRAYMSSRCRAFRQASDTTRRLAVQELEDAGWLFPDPDARAYGGWSSTVWAVNPRIFDRFAAQGEEHRQHRAAVRSMFL